jgi:ABC-type glycerol-3-phosphate transport system substrate-binding protein
MRIRLAEKRLGQGRFCKMKSKFSRRGALRALAFAGSAGVGAAALAACGDATVITKTEIVEVEVDRVVEVVKEVPVEIEKIVEVSAKTQSATITYWMQQWDDGVAAFQGAIDSFQAANPMYKVEMVPIGYGDLFAKFYPSIVTETSGDVVYTYSEWWKPIDVSKVLHPMTPTLRSRSEFQGIFFPAALESVSSLSDEFYVIPLICGMGGPICIVNLDTAEAAGINPDTMNDSWETMEAAFNQGTEKDGDKFVTGGINISWSRLGAWVQAMVQQLGSSYYNADTELFDWNTSEAEAAVRFTTDVMRAYNSRELIADADGNAMAKGTHLTDIDGLWKISSYGNAFPDLNLAAMAMPAFPGAKELIYESDSVASIAIPKFVQGAKLEAAQSFMVHLWQPENLAAFGEFYSGSHSVKQVYDDPNFLNSKWGGVGAAFVPEEVWPFITYPPHRVAALSAEWSAPLEKVTYDGMAPADAAFEVQGRTSLLNKEATDRFKAGD